MFRHFTCKLAANNRNRNDFQSLNAHTNPVECVKFGHTEEFVCSGSQAGQLNIWDLEANKKTRTFEGHIDAIKCMDFHPYGDFLTSGSLDTSIKVRYFKFTCFYITLSFVICH